MKRVLAVLFVVAMGGALTAPVMGDDTRGQKVKTGVQKTGDAAHTVGNKVAAAQQSLKDKGHDPGMIDGKMGPRTRATVSDYQKLEGLKVTGRLDDDTRAKLGM
jgi:peptidoglycan hydrolase-like protein with peptidoglycan-binding domain